jgi:YegS/Rv2252/BmrU family lipid kinase
MVISVKSYGCKKKVNCIFTKNLTIDLTEDKNWFAIVNPKAGSGKGKKDWPTIQNLLIEEGIDFDFALTQRKFHAVELAVSAAKKGYRKILSVGGDGTLNEIVNGVFIQKDVSTTDILIGVIGVGTGNDWQRMYGIPNTYHGKIKAIKEENTFLQDVGRVNFFESRINHDRYFANAGGVGFDAEVALSTNTLKEAGRKGKILYMYSLLKTLFAYQTTMVSVKIDDEKINGKIFSITLGIGKYNGGGMIQLPKASPDDGLFDITVIKDMSRLDVIRNIHRLYNGSILNHPKIFGYQGYNVAISSKPHLNLEVDGESLGSSPFTFSILPKSIRVVVGADFKGVEHVNAELK